MLLYVHLSEAAITGTGTGTDGCRLELARVENHRQVITADQIRTWCANPDTKVTVKPVIDLAEHMDHATRSRTPREQARSGRHLHLPLVHPTSSICDSDHITPTPTAAYLQHNIAPFCRRYYRLKIYISVIYIIIDFGI